MIEARTFEVEGCEYTLNQFGAKVGQRWLLRLTKAVAPALVRGASASDTQALAAVLELASESLPEAMLDELCAAFAERCQVRFSDGSVRPLSAVYDDHFAGNYVALAKWLRGCLEANYGGFMLALQSAGATPRAK